MPREEQRFAALQAFAFHLGAQGRDKELGELFEDMHVALDDTTNDKFKSVIGISAELGYSAAGKREPQQVLSIADKIVQVPDQSQDWSTEIIVPYLIRRKQLKEAIDLTNKIIADKRGPGCYNNLLRSVVIWALHGEASQAVAIAQQCQNERNQYLLTLEVVGALTQRGGESDIKTAGELLQATERKHPLLSSEAPGGCIPGIATLLVLQNRTVDAKNYILRAFKDILADARRGGFNSLPEVLSAAEEMARRGHAEDSRAIFLRIIADKQDPDDPEVFALKLKAGLISDNEVRLHAQSVMNIAAAGEHPFSFAKDAALSARLYALVGATKEVRKSLVLMMRGLPRLRPEEERGRTLLSVASLIKHLDHDEIKSLSSVAAKIADQEPTVESGDDILRALSPLLARYKSLHLGRPGGADCFCGRKVGNIYSSPRCLSFERQPADKHHG